MHRQIMIEAESVRTAELLNCVVQLVSSCVNSTVFFIS